MIYIYKHILTSFNLLLPWYVYSRHNKLLDLPGMAITVAMRYSVAGSESPLHVADLPTPSSWTVARNLPESMTPKEISYTVTEGLIRQQNPFFSLSQTNKKSGSKFNKTEMNAHLSCNRGQMFIV